MWSIAYYFWSSCTIDESLKIKSKTISSENDNTNLSLLKDNMNEYYNISKIYIKNTETFIKNNGLEKEYPIEILKRINNGRELYLKSTKETRDYVKKMICGVLLTTFGLVVLLMKALK